MITLRDVLIINSLHELTHALEYMLNPEQFYEPYFENECAAELGNSMTNAVSCSLEVLV